MIPEVRLDSFWIGPIRIHAFGTLVVLGIIAGHTVLVRRARGLASPARVEGFAMALGAGGVAAGLVAERLVGDLSLAFAAAGAVAAAVTYLLALRLPLLPFLDAAAEAFPAGWILARLGCALVHDHLGPPSRSVFAVAFATGPRLDLGLLEWLLTPVLFLAAALGRRRGRPGHVAAAVAATYAIIRLPLDALRTDDARYGGLTATQWGAIPVLLAAIALLLAQGQPVRRNDR